MQRFRILGLIETSAERFLIIKEKKLTDYLAQIINSKLKLVRSIGALDSENAGKYLNLEAGYAGAQQAGIRPPGWLNLNGERQLSSQDAVSSLV